MDEELKPSERNWNKQCNIFAKYTNTAS